MHLAHHRYFGASLRAVRAIIRRHCFPLHNTRAMYRVRLHRLGSLLGLLAILMVTLAPTVSQVLASHHRLGDALATYCSADGEITSAAHDGHSSHSPTAHWQACPYCGLIAHVPVLPGTPLVLAVPLRSGPMAVAVASAVVRAISVHTVAQSRAPPVFS